MSLLVVLVRVVCCCLAYGSQRSCQPGSRHRRGEEDPCGEQAERAVRSREGEVGGGPAPG